jgi:hypothetical protein
VLDTVPNAPMTLEAVRMSHALWMAVTNNWMLKSALGYAEMGWPVFPLWTVVEVDGGWICACPKGADCKDPGKHPLGALVQHGVSEATLDAAFITSWWGRFPLANIAVDLGRARLIDIAPDSVEWQAAFIANGLPPTIDFASPGGEGHSHYLYARPPDCPAERICIADQYDIMSAGYAVMPPSLGVGGRRYRMRRLASLAAGEPWMVQRLVDKAGARGSNNVIIDLETDAAINDGNPPVELTDEQQRIWDGEVLADDRSNGLVELARMLRDAGASDAQILAALEERDAALGWNKYTDRGDRAIRYREIVTQYAKRAPPEVKLTGGGAWKGDFSRLTPAREAPENSNRPERLSEAAFYGPLGEFVKAAAKDSEADPAGILGMQLTTVGVLLGNKAYAMAGDAEHPPRINTVLVGPTSKGRKGTAGKLAERVAEAVEGPKFNSHVVDGLSSGEGLIWAIHDPILEWDKKNKGWIDKDPGVDDKRLIVLESEFAVMLRILQREGNSLGGVIRKAWDLSRYGVLQALVKNSPTKATGAHVAIGGHVPRDELVRYVDRTDLVNGFANRFLWLAVKRAQELPFGESIDTRIVETFAQQVKEARVWANQGQRLTWAKRVGERWRAEYHTLGLDHPGLYGGAIARGEAQVLRLVVLYAILDQTTELEERHLDAALELWRYSDRTCLWMFGDIVGDDVADTILSALRTAGPLTRDQIYEVTGRHIKRSRVDQALRLLERNGLAERLIGESTGGRPPEVWQAVEKSPGVARG